MHETEQPAIHSDLLPMPTPCTDRTVLIMMRRMGGHGLHDAHAAMLAMKHFGTGFRQPLVLLRCYIAEIAQASRRSITIANCCAPRMTRDEGMLLDVLIFCAHRPQLATDRLADLTGCGKTQRAFTVACATHTALNNLGYFLGPVDNRDSHWA